MLGTGPQQSALQTLAAQLGISERVKFVGAVAHLDLPSHYQKAAINILSSRHEGLGMVTLEAAACGIPTISTAVGLLPDHPSMGISIPVGDDAALAAAIDALLTDDQLRTRLAQSAYKMVQDQFTIQHTVEQFRRLYAELIETASR
jgi:glycosyltransferase involved in cell wall biosynthesis